MFLEGSPFRDRSILLRDGGVVHLADGDFTVTMPSNQHRWIRLRTDLPLFPITSPAGEAPAEYVIRQLEVNSVSSAHYVYRNTLRGFGIYLLRMGWDTFRWADVDEATLLRYLSRLRAGDREHDFARLRQFYVWAADAEYCGFDPGVADKLTALRIKGTRKGIDVLTGNPITGPLTNDAFRRLLQLLSSYDGPLLPQLCVLLCIELGANVAQICQIRRRDFLVYETTGSDPIYHIDMPRSKKGDNYVGRKRRPLSPRLGALLGDYVSDTAQARASLGMDDPFLLLSAKGKPMSGASFYQYLQRFSEDSGFGKAVEGRLSVRRLRKTMATRLVEEGASEEDVMNVLDHTDAQNVGIYFEMRGGSLSRIDLAVDAALEPIAARFSGRLVDFETDAHLGDRPEQRVKAPVEVSDVGIGTCGRDMRAEGLCWLNPPYACYTCPLFQPWRDADHRGFAAKIREQRDEVAVLEGGDEGGRVAGQLDGLLAAVEEVVAACEIPPPEPERRTRRGRDSGGER